MLPQRTFARQISLADMFLGLFASLFCVIAMFSFLHWWRVIILRPDALHGGPYQPTLMKTPGATVPPTATPQYLIYLPTELKLQMLNQINQARIVAGVRPVAWDDLAAQVARHHAEEMVRDNYFSHWDNLGLGPDHRYSLAGGQHAAMENLYAYQYAYSNGQGAPIADWTGLINEAHNGLMFSEGHRRNILDPAHTHVGIGLAYDEAIGEFRLDQLFTNQYTLLSYPLPQDAQLGDTIIVHGYFTTPTPPVNILINLAYEPFRTPLDLAARQSGRPYTSPAKPIAGWIGSPTFYQTITFDYAQGAGFYHLRIFAEIDEVTTLVINHLIAVYE